MEHATSFHVKRCVGACSYSVAIMMDTEGSEVHLHEFQQPQKAEVSPLSAWLSTP